MRGHTAKGVNPRGSSNICLQMFGTIRIGEAKNPGPGQGRFIIGCINPCGLMGKAELIGALPGAQGVWGISETHLSHYGVRKFKDQLRYSARGYKIIPGHPAPLKSTTIGAVGGKHTGTALVSNAPSRPLASNTSLETWETSRTVAGVFRMGERWIVGGTVYGYAEQPNSIPTRERTTKLLATISQQVVYGQKGPRFLSGDWNQDLAKLEIARQWEAEGWVELQQYAKERWGQEVQVTCKGVTTKDFVYISPELRSRLVEVKVDDTWFPDHAILYGVFDTYGSPEPITAWPTAKPIELASDLPDQGAQLYDPTRTADDNYRAIWEAYEERIGDYLEAQGKTLRQSHKGRAQATEVITVHPTIPPPRPGPLDGVRTEYDGTNLRHARWLRQTRRLESLARLHQAQTWTAYHHQHAGELWRAILKAPGFSPNYAQWAGTYNSPPRGTRLLQLRDQMQQSVKDYEATLIKERTAKAKQARKDNPYRIFGDLRRETSEKVQTVISPHKTRVLEVDPEGTITVEDATQLAGPEPLFTNHGMLRLRSIQGSELRVENSELPKPGDLIWRDEVLGTPREIFQAFQAEWEKR